MLDLRARSALLAAITSGTDEGVRVAEVIMTARRLAHAPSPCARPLARLLEAGAASVRSKREVAIQHLRAAGEGFDAVDMALHAAVTRWRLGEFLGGDQGAALVASSQAWMRGQSVRNPERFAAMLAPVRAS